MALHRWAWLVAHEHATDKLPGDLVHVRRTCSGRLCCNPKHLYAASPDGSRLTIQDIFGAKDEKTSSVVEPGLRAPDGDGKDSDDADAYLRSVLMY
jgi:hypothetical protein